MLVARRLRLMGRVQGVGFRHFVAQAARAERVRGWVRNMTDGSVEALLEGEADAVQRVEEQVRRGPRRANVTSVLRADEAASGLSEGFRIEG